MSDDERVVGCVSLHRLQLSSSGVVINQMVAREALLCAHDVEGRVAPTSPASTFLEAHQVSAPPMPATTVATALEGQR